MSLALETYIAAQRLLLVRLEEFSRTPGYARLLQALRKFSSEDPESWLAEWLVSYVPGLGSRPIDIAGDHDGIDRLVVQLARMADGTVA